LTAVVHSHIFASSTHRLAVWTRSTRFTSPDLKVVLFLVVGLFQLSSDGPL
jgi:hypothetical protein